MDRLIRLSEVASSKEAGISKWLAKLETGESLVAADYSDLPIIRERLTPPEKSLFDEDSVTGARVLLHAQAAVNATRDLYETAKDVIRNGNGDAFRHLYWNYKMASDPNVGASWAERWANAHEEGVPTQPVLERTMDLHNNRRGRQQAADGVDDRPRILRSAVRNGSCRIVRDNTLVKSDQVGELPDP